MITENIGHLPKKLVGKFGCIDIIEMKQEELPLSATFFIL